jgi:hypothetical protein
VVADTDQWEQSAAYIIDHYPAVGAFVKNKAHDYEPDFIMRLKSGDDECSQRGKKLRPLAIRNGSKRRSGSHNIGARASSRPNPSPLGEGAGERLLVPDADGVGGFAIEGEAIGLRAGSVRNGEVNEIALRTMEFAIALSMMKR